MSLRLWKRGLRLRHGNTAEPGIAAFQFLILSFFIFGEIGTFADDFAEPLFNSRPLERDFPAVTVGIENYAGRRTIIYKTVRTIQKIKAAASGSVFISDKRGGFLFVCPTLIHGVNPQFSAFKAGTVPEFLVNVRLRDSKSGGRFHALRFVDANNLFVFRRK